MRSKGWLVRLRSLAGAWKADLGPWRHAESIRLKVILHLMKLITPKMLKV